MPSALSKMGIFLGIFVIAWAGCTSAFGLYLQTRCARYIDRGPSITTAIRSASWAVCSR